MVNSAELVEEISESTARHSVLSYLFRRDADHEDHLLVSKLFPVEYKMKSGIHGLTTSLGTSLWESLAKRIASNNGFTEIVGADLEEVDQAASPNFPQAIHSLVGSWTASRPIDPATNEWRSMLDFIGQLKSIVEQTSPRPQLIFKQLSHGQGIDVFLEKNGIEYAFDLKTVQPTSSSGNNYYHRLINWYQFRYLQKEYQAQLNSQRTKPFEGHFVIPYDTTQRGWWLENAASASPLTKFDLLVGNDFWDFVSGIKGTIEAIERGFQNIANDLELVSLYRQCIADGGDAPRFNLLQYERHLKPLEEIKISSRASKFFKCLSCGEQISLKLEQVLSSDYRCPGH
jgi:Type II restriction endonuclease, TdeIII